MSEENHNLFCSFCGKQQKQVEKLIAGPNVYICNECIELCYSIIKQTSESQEKQFSSIPSPREIHSYLDEYVIGQEYAKMVISVAVFNHYQRLENPVVDDVELDKSNILLTGPTGSGKTLIAQIIAKLLDVPFAIADATTLTESGYVGDDVESIVVKLLQNADYDVEKAQKGIIYIDEIDKKAMRGDNASISRDVSGEGVQQALLKIIEGTTCRVPPQGGRKNPQQQELVEVDTSKMLFIVGGAFVGLDKIIHESENKDASIGFNAEIAEPNEQRVSSELLTKLQPDHLVKFGLIPELVGRLPVFSHLYELNKDQLKQVLLEPKNALVKQFKKMFSLENIELEFTDEALDEIANTAIERGTGARGLRSVMEKALIPVQYELPDLKNQNVEKVIINKNVITNNQKPEFVYHDSNGTNQA